MMLESFGERLENLFTIVNVEEKNVYLFGNLKDNVFYLLTVETNLHK